MGIIALTYFHGICNLEKPVANCISKSKLEFLDLLLYDLKPAMQVRDSVQVENEEAHGYEDFCDLAEDTSQKFNFCW